MSTPKQNLPCLGCVPYLNAKPLIEALTPPPLFLEPSLLSEELRAGRVDAALVPIVECLQHPEYFLVDNVGIGSNGPVQSVLLTGTRNLSTLRTVAPDPASRTSNHLVRALLELYGNKTASWVPPQSPADGRVLIGDPALHHHRENPDGNWVDLGAAWKEKTGLPFVFAVWAIRSDRAADALQIAQALRKAKNRGILKIESLASTPLDLNYLRNALRFDLGTAEKKGIERFAQLLVSLNVLADIPKLRWI